MREARRRRSHRRIQVEFSRAKGPLETHKSATFVVLVGGV
jgi:hypothetical protein